MVRVTAEVCDVTQPRFTDLQWWAAENEPEFLVAYAFMHFLELQKSIAVTKFTAVETISSLKASKNGHKHLRPVTGDLIEISSRSFTQENSSPWAWQSSGIIGSC